MEITGKLLEKLPQQKGEGRKGPWVKQQFIVETQEQFPKTICIMLWGDKTQDLESKNIGDTLKVSVNIESREFNGKWYTDVKAWRMEKLGDTPQAAETPEPPPMPSMDDLPPEIPNDGEDDLPF
ncbi:MAG: DUF3127 domain-containing protein [Perlabentimonas sp.]